MPMDRKNYPKDWPEIRERILARATFPGSCVPACEWCRVSNHSVVWWDAEENQYSGLSHRGDRVQSFASMGMDIKGKPLTYKAAELHCAQMNTNSGRSANPWIVIVLTIMHLNHDTKDNRDENLKAACQRCHNRHDLPFRTANKKAKRAKKRGQKLLFTTEGTENTEKGK